jgi:chromosome segregation ATPase
VAADVNQHEDFIRNTENPPTERREVEGSLSRLKTRLESLENEEQQRQAREIEAEQQLQADDVKLSELRDRLERLDNALENASRRPGGSSH